MKRYSFARHTELNVKFKQYSSVRRLMSRMVNADGESMPEAMLKQLESCGMHAYSGNGEVHFWHDGKRTPAELAMLIGHELGHLVGKPARGFKAEEDRADDYGRVAVHALRMVMKQRHRKAKR